MTSVLLVRLGGLGDLLVALPSMRLLRAAFPGASLRLLARREPGRLVRGAGVVDDAYDADDPAWAGLFDRDRAASLPVSADAIFGWFHGGGTGLPESPRVRTISYDWGSGVPLSRFFFDRTAELVRARGGALAAFEDCRLLFHGPPPGRRPFAVIHPGSGGRAKRWPLDRFLAVAGALASEGIGGRIVTGEAEEDLERALSVAPLPSGWIHVSRPPLALLAEDLRRAAVYVGNDSGVTHLAAACGVPAVAVFRDENLAAWRPAGPVAVLSAPRPEDVPVEAVTAAMRGILEKNW